MENNKRTKVVVIGAGFGGLQVAKSLAKYPIDVLLIDRNNYHLFTPLLYQVATCGLGTSEIAYPVRSIFRKNKNVNFLLGEVTSIDYNAKHVDVRINGRSVQEHYDYLVVAAGSVTNYFGNPQLEQYGFGLKDLKDAVRLRNHILKLFEKAAWTEDTKKRAALTTLVVVGGGPTGLETAGALYELYNSVLKAEFSKSYELHARVILIEATDRLLAPYPERLQNSALEQLKSMGVEVIMGQAVQEADFNHVKLTSGDVIHTHTLIWAAGVKASPFAKMLDVESSRGGRIPVDEMMRITERENVFAIGDIAHLINPANDRPYAQVIPVAQQQGRLVAGNILRELRGEEPEAFVYEDRGIMATIGRRRAVAYPFYKIQLTGFVAWVTWLFLHLVWLMGFRNRITVLVNWVWNYVMYDRSVRIILERDPDPSIEIIEKRYEQQALPQEVIASKEQDMPQEKAS